MPPPDPSSEPVDAPKSSPAKYRILIADDNADSAASLAALLRVLGHDVRTARDGLEALETAAGFRPEVALLDIGMPRLNGYETALRMRSEPWGSRTILIAVTGWSQEGHIGRSRDAGFDHHLIKPVELGTLSEILSSVRP